MTEQGLIPDIQLADQVDSTRLPFLLGWNAQGTLRVVRRASC